MLSHRFVARLFAGCLALAPLAACGDGGGDGEGTGSVDTPLCAYPEFSGQLQIGETFPNLAYTNVLDVDGSTLDFSFEDFFCDDAFDAFESVFVVVSAGWCSACPDYLAATNSVAGQLAAEGSLLVYIEVETADFEDATAEDAAAFIDRSVAPETFIAGLRTGEADRTSEAGIRQSVRQFPSAYFVRRRDMQIVADQAATPFRLNFTALAADPEQAWEPVRPPFMAQCGPSDEEAGEPNDTFETASPVEVGTDVEGGVCMDGPDFYFVDRPGPWRFDLFQSLFTEPEPASRNVDLRLWSVDGERLGGSNAIANNDAVEWQGPAYVEVYGENGRSGTYRVSLRDL